jgi:hypothetical protein
MDTLLELKEKAKKNNLLFGIDTEFTITTLSSIRKQFVTCYKCKYKDMITDTSKFVKACPKCSEEKNITLKIASYAIVDDGTYKAGLDLWESDITRFKVGDKVRLINGVCKFKLTKDEDGNLTVESIFLNKRSGQTKGILEVII